MEASGRGQVNETLARASSSLSGQRSPWHSPVPYLFGGLAAMLGLIAFALLILACSYWKLSGYLEGGNTESGDVQQQDLESGNKDEEPRKPPVFKEDVLVIMAGQVKPTFLATPASSRSSSFGNNTNCGGCECKPKNWDVEMANQAGSGEGSLGTDTQENLPEGH
ncbi:hypothetical protein MLD38_014517 [Melastoma candidum]|uniref:Uncharacterized protein n=1 Tax=Melastoma candidum TaxID=119954 RepID=A0ACB9RD77_9MYRT|nr:hypothetical protein MLD38_014517 [Melastoma candidum]